MKKLFIAGHNGMVGGAIVKAVTNSVQLKDEYRIITRTRADLDLIDQHAVRKFMEVERPDEVIIAAAMVGGIHANNTYPADFLYRNTQIAFNLISESHAVGVKKLLQLGSSCIYPREAEQPMKEDALLTGKLEPTNEPYAIAKIAAIKLCESFNRQHGTDFRSVMPTNLYGPGDNFHPEDSHVLPALIARFHQASVLGHSTVAIWGTGSAKREFLHVNDMAEACLFVHKLSSDEYATVTSPMQSHINIGTGQDISIYNLAMMIAEITGFKGNIETDASKPDGAPRKLLDTSTAIGLGWKPKITLADGIRQTYKWFTENVDCLRI